MGGEDCFVVLHEGVAVCAEFVPIGICEFFFDFFVEAADELIDFVWAEVSSWFPES